MKAHNAKFCVECSEVLDITESACPSCTCSAFFPLISILEPMGARKLRIVEQSFMQLAAERLESADTLIAQIKADLARREQRLA